MSKKVYILTSGSYSDYHIVGVTDDKNLADNISEKWYTDIEEYELIESETWPIIKDKNRYSLAMDKEGDTVYIHNSDPVNDTNTSLILENVKSRGVEFTYLYIECWATSEEHAVKIANEIRTQLIASGEWDLKEREK